MAQKRILLITSNIGSLFGEKLDIYKYWLDQISKEVAKNRPEFFALHVQESGGKNYKLHSKEMSPLVEELQRRLVQLGFALSRCFLDIQYDVVEEYTALSSLFFVHESALEYVSQYNFRQRKFLSTPEYQELYGHKVVFNSGLVRSGFVRKEKFSRDFWPNFRFGRKGFLHTRWQIDGRIFDLINIHLFHDESNLNFFENPTQYSNNRKNALNYVLHKFEKFNGGTIEGNSSLFIFGDFNFRLDLGKLVKKLTNQTSEREVFLTSSSFAQKATAFSTSNSPLDSSGGTISSSLFGSEESSEESLLQNTHNRSISTEPSASSSESDFRTSCDDYDEASADDLCVMASAMKRKNSVIEYYKPVVREYLSPFDAPGGNGSWVLRIGKKRFEYFDPGWLLHEWKSYKEDDCEPHGFPLNEMQLEFPPTYPWSEDPKCHQNFMNTRAPAWCDRILFNGNALKLVKQNNGIYRSFGMDNCIGDHKPVLLGFSIP